MRILPLFVFLLTLYSEASLAETPLTWATIEEGEAQAKGWLGSLDDAEVLALGMSHRQPAELETLRAFYPYLLPEGFYNRSMDLSCYPSFLAFQHARDQVAFNMWAQCVAELWRDEPPSPTARALKDLEP